MTDCRNEAIFDVTLPDGVHLPSSIQQRILFLAITLFVPLELLGPVVDVRLWKFERASRTPMPEAAVDEYRDLLSGIADVWLADHSSILVSDRPV